MPRPIKKRCICHLPDITFFQPKGSHINGEVILKYEELESIRLKDLESMEQEECAVSMEISRPTFQRILLSAREKIADALVNGKSIRIEGGNYKRAHCMMECTKCGHKWNSNIEINDHTHKNCPNCGTIVPCRRGRGQCRGHCRKNNC